jgi:hypothetical protein
MRPMRRCYPIALASCLGAVVFAGGCLDSADRSRAAQSESVLSLLPAPPTPAQAAAWAGDPYDPDKRFRGTVLLSNAPWGGESVYLDLYRARLGAMPNTEPDADPSVRAAAAFALGLHGSPDDAPTVAKLLTEDDRLVRITAVRSLQRIHNPLVVPALIDRTWPGPPDGVLDPQDHRKPELDPDIRAEAADALAQYPETRVFQSLVAALGDDRFIVTSAARKSLKTLTGQDFGDDHKKWLEWGERPDCFAARTPYVYPTFSREKGWLEYLPFFPEPARNEIPGSPVGLAAEGETPAQDRPGEPLPSK